MTLETQSIFAQGLDSPGYLLLELPQSYRENISNNINAIIAETDITTNVRPYLRSHISHQFEYPQDENLQYLLLELTAQYQAKFGSHPSKEFAGKTPLYEPSQTWVNFQKKGEYSPIHTHSGAYSWTIWVRVPYKIADEREVYGDIENNQAASYNFHYTDAYGQMSAIHLPVDETFEWKMVFFPSGLSHSVNPFMTSDDFRISVSGNIIAK